MKDIFENRINLILIIVVLVVAILIFVPVTTRGCFTSTSTGEIVTSPATKDEATTEATTTEGTTSDVDIKDATIEIKKKNASKASAETASEKTDPRKTDNTGSKSSDKTTDETADETTDKTESETSKKSKSGKSTSSKVYATAATAETAADHDVQWGLGYLVAIDTPDKSYSCGHIELTDKDRELIEKLCMGEFGSGGFTGASLIAQAVKNAMYFRGFTSVRDVIDSFHYTGKLKKPTQRVKDAVVYVFDMDKDAIQHRILYMYNPEKTEDEYSDFHEGKKYICTFKDVRFFDD